MTKRLRTLTPAGGARGTRPPRNIGTAMCLAAAASFAFILTACSNPEGTGGLTGPGGAFTLSGLVSEATPDGRAPVERAIVSVGTATAFTGEDGRYSLPGLSRMNAVVRVTKAGFVLQSFTVLIAADTQLDIQIVREPPIPTYTLSGSVFEMTPEGRHAVESVQVYCDSCGPDGHTFAYTDAQGFYSFSGVRNGITPLLIRKEGYAVVGASSTFPDGTGVRTALVNGDTSLDLELARR